MVQSGFEGICSKARVSISGSYTSDGIQARVVLNRQMMTAQESCNNRMGVDVACFTGAARNLFNSTRQTDSDSD